jgi:hypothetical protein
MAELHRRGVKLRKPPIFHRDGIPGSGGPDWLRNDYEFIVCASQGRLPWSDNTVMGHSPKYPTGGRLSHRNAHGQRRNSCNYGKLPSGGYTTPAKANPGNVIHCVMGGGNMGNRLCHENEAPFPEKLAEFFIRSFCPPGGLVLDPFCGSGTTCAIASQHGRDYIGIDVRQSQIDLTTRRLAEV